MTRDRILFRPHSRRRAAVVVEMAIALPVMLIVVLGIIEFGRAMMVSNLLTSAAREGAREAALPDRNDTEVKAVVVARLNASNIPATTSDVKVLVNGVEKDASNATTGDTITVTVTITVQKVTWLPTSFFFKSTDKLSGQAVMRRE
jgi:Flp pilus assembly protein TadG